MMKHYIDTSYYLGQQQIYLPIEITPEEHNIKANKVLKADREALKDLIKIKEPKLKQDQKEKIKIKEELELLTADIWDIAYARMVIHNDPIQQLPESEYKLRIKEFPL